MSIKQIMSAFENAVSGTKVCWMRDERSFRISVMAIIPESNRRAAVADCSRRMAVRARRTAEREAMRIGRVVSTGVFMGGEGKGLVNAIGIADVELTPETEHRLSVSGIPQIH